MYASIHSYVFNQKYSEEIDKKVRDIFLPQIEKLPGFISYYWVDSGDGEGASVSIFEDKATAMASLHLAASFRKQHLGRLGLSAPTSTLGDIEAFTERTPPASRKEKSISAQAAPP